MSQILDAPVWCSTCSGSEAWSLRTAFGVRSGTKGYIHGALWVLWDCPNGGTGHGRIALPLEGLIHVPGLN